MDTTHSVDQSNIEQFWDSYFAILTLFGIPEKTQPWYRKIIEAFIEYSPDIRLIHRGSEHVEQWLTRLGKRSQLEDWQFRQQVDALRLLYCHRLKSPWAAEFDWAYWSSGATRLETEHASIKQTYEIIDDTVKSSGNYFGAQFANIYRKFLVAIRIPGYAINTEKSYLSWINQFLLFHRGIAPKQLREAEVASFLEHLVIKRKVASSTQAQALNALVFFFAKVLEDPLGQIGNFKRSSRPKRIPTVLSPVEIDRLFKEISGLQGLMIRLMYGTGMRVMECVRLRILDLDFAYKQIIVRASKGNKDRVVPIPDSLANQLQNQIYQVTQYHDVDFEQGYGRVFIPTALARKYPNAETELRWQYLFPASKLARDPRTGVMRRHHIHQSVIQKLIKKASARANIVKRVTSHTMRHSFATHLLESGADIRDRTGFARTC